MYNTDSVVLHCTSVKKYGCGDGTRYVEDFLLSNVEDLIFERDFSFDLKLFFDKFSSYDYIQGWFKGWLKGGDC